MWLAHAFALGLRSETLADSCERSNDEGEIWMFTEAGHQQVKTEKKQLFISSVDSIGFNCDLRWNNLPKISSHMETAQCTASH